MLGPHDEWEYDWLETQTIGGRSERVLGPRRVVRDVGIWDLGGYEWADVETAQRTLSEIFAGRNHFEPDSPDMVMDIIDRQRPTRTGTGGPIFMDGFEQYTQTPWPNPEPPKPVLPKPAFIGARGPRPLNLDE